jgi:phosphoribosylformylglycinamidine synthase subunit PurSL
MQRTLITLFSKDHPKHQVFWIDHEKHIPAEEIEALKNRLSDSVDQNMVVGCNEAFMNEFSRMTNAEVIYYGRGVTDNSAKSFKELLSRTDVFKGMDFEVHSGHLIEKELKADFNPLIQERLDLNSNNSVSIEHIDFSLNLHTEITVHTYQLSALSDDELNALSLKNCWALNLAEIKIVRDHYTSPQVTELRLKSGLSQNPTDVEMEMIAQTWSEHCKHKIFGAEIDYEDEKGKVKINGLFKEYIKNPTHALKKDWAVSLFDDNAGIVRFRDGIDLCIKVETHNSPSALDPYGGALTGILGVNRDIMGTGLGARPVANTDVFCVGMPDEDELPSNLLHPTEILKGIHRGVQDGGNKSGIPTVNGAIYFDESFSGKPLVYCGTVGVLPPKVGDLPSSSKNQNTGDYIVMVGGAVGIDGIHGATASSLVMDKHTTIGMVQIGDPFSQKRMMDFLLAARDKMLYTSITDNGAGGLSSSVGEMSQATNGAHLHLERVPLKYRGLAPWQILVSESQERMTLSVAKNKMQEIEDLAKLYQVQLTNIGEFKNDGLFTCTFNHNLVCQIQLSFLHGGLPKMKLKARHEKMPFVSWKKTKQPLAIDSKNHFEITKRLLSHPVISSKEKWIRQYDHEVQGATVVKPLEGMKTSSPNDAGVIWYGAHGVQGTDGFAVASGLCPHFSMDDALMMSKLAVDEAVRNLICHGADPDKIALVDNFCWPDPTPSPKNPDAEFKLAQLVRTCMGLKDMIETYGMPLVSGKDSMKNDYHGEKVKISVLPTLLVTALGHIPDVRITPKSQARANNLLYRVGARQYDRYFGHFLHKVVPDLKRDNEREFDFKTIRMLYQNMFSAIQSGAVESAHDISEGGFMVALTETLMMDDLGIDLIHLVREGEDLNAFLYSELPGHFIVSVPQDKRMAFEKHFESSEIQYIDIVNSSGKITLNQKDLNVSELAAAWGGTK